MLTLNNLKKSYDQTSILNGISLSIETGEIVSILGPSGSGKTTLLNCILGITEIDSGSVVFNGQDVTGVSMEERGFNIVFQDYALFPNLNAYENITYGLKNKPGISTQQEVNELIELLGLSQHLDKHIDQLSGGQKQRVALARALVIEPSVLLFDEPLSNLDAKLRVTMRTEIRKIQQKVGITAIYVTHDQSEAMSISDKIIIMSKGKVEQIGTPREIYYHPNSRFVADFIGEANFLEARVRSASGEKAVIDVVGQELTVNNFAKAGPGDDVVLVIRPEGATLAEQGLLEGTVTLSTFMGSYQYYQVMVGNMEIQITDYNPVNRRIYEVGEKAYLDFDPKGVYIL